MAASSKSNKVLFAEAGKDFVDFLFNLLCLPLGTVTKLLKTNSMVGSMVGSHGSLYESIEKLSETYMQPNQNKDSLLNPRAPTPASGVPLLLGYDAGRKVYMCPNSYHRDVADDSGMACPQCKKRMETEVTVVGPNVGKGETTDGGGFVKGVFNVKDVGALQEKVVDLGMNEALRLLKDSLESKTVLTSVFLGNKKF
ncbi:hypothetical protein ES319_A10G230500v1 [Gossypium barbadense]|uniref:DUF674 domain-containing protein n=1 Tax=Gossypium barbadense TaxID=3634 RepID=A0A5J5U6Y8_GOSBA|nr:hypothetical protein ES319_A10G230500v1 [Gossypium barbadense]